MDVRFFANQSGLQVLPLEMMHPDYSDGQLDLSQNGIRTEYWVSVDGGNHYVNYEDLSAENAAQVTNVVGRVFFSDTINYTGKRLYCVARLPVQLNENNLTDNELSGNDPIQGWVYRTPTLSRDIKLNTKLYLQQPLITGTIKTNSDKNWDEGTPLGNHVVELVEIDPLREETVVAEATTLSDGTYSFEEEITSFNNIKIKLTEKSGYTSYFYYVDRETGEESYLETNHIIAGNLPAILLSNERNIYSWFEQPGQQSLAGASRSLDFLLVEAIPEEQYFTVTYTDGVDRETVFEDQVYTVAEGEATPPFGGTPARDGYIFNGWRPEVAATVTEDATYIAQWKKAVGPGPGSMYSVTLHKTDAATGVALKDAEFKLYDQNDKLLGTYVTEENGIITVKNLQNGEYYFVESKVQRVMFQMTANLNLPFKTWI